MLSNAVIGYLESELGWSPAFSARLFPYYLSTLRRMAEGRPAVVLKAVDEMWHAHILSTRDYQEFCGDEFGSFVHHALGEPSGEPVSWEGMFADDGLDPSELVALCGAKPKDADLLKTVKCSRPRPMPAPPR